MLDPTSPVSYSPIISRWQGLLLFRKLSTLRADSLHSLQIFIGNLSPDCDGKDLRDFFRDYGVCNDAWVARKPPGFGFVWLNDERDAVHLPFSPSDRRIPASMPFQHLSATARPVPPPLPP
jgi:hypothetical protein